MCTLFDSNWCRTQSYNIRQRNESKVKVIRKSQIDLSDKY